LSELSKQPSQPAAVSPSLPLQSYVGTYTDPCRQADDRLQIHAPNERHSRALVTDKSIEPAHVTFSLDANGKVARIALKAVSPIADFSYDYQDLLFTPAK
jgi:hypothetical protein